MKKTLWLLAYFGILSACSCHKTPVEPAFQNSFSCKINGQLWEPNGKDGFFGFQKTLSFYFAPNETGLGIYADNKRDNQFISIACYCNAQKGIYKMRIGSFLEFGKVCSFVLDTLKSRTITLTKIDSVKRILVGEFDYTVYKTGGTCSDTLKITDGKFELNY